MATPLLDRARTEVLTSYEIVLALKELEILNGAGARVGIEIQSLGGRCQARIFWLNFGGGYSRWCPSIEDALVAEHDELKRCMAEVS